MVDRPLGIYPGGIEVGLEVGRFSVSNHIDFQSDQNKILRIVINFCWRGFTQQLTETGVEIQSRTLEKKGEGLWEPEEPRTTQEISQN